MFKLTSTQVLTLTNSNGCALGSASQEITVFFKIDSVTVKNGSASAVVYAGLSEDLTTGLYGFYPVTIDDAGGSVLTQAETQVMALDEFSGATTA